MDRQRQLETPLQKSTHESGKEEEEEEEEI
jgi:hypothetical protein